jgi:hypothetical protein
MTSGRLVEGRCKACGADVPERAVSADFGPLEAYTASHAEQHEVTVPGFEYASVSPAASCSPGATLSRGRNGGTFATLPRLSRPVLNGTDWVQNLPR